jgi:hypothetical protein
MEIKIYIANLAKYNEGILKGKWVTLPCDLDELQEKINEVLGNDEEIAIHDYEAPFNIHEYHSVYDLNERMQGIEKVEIDYDTAKAIYCNVSNFDEFIEVLENGEYCVVERVDTPQELALNVDYEYLPFDYYSLERYKNNVLRYIDWDSVGNDMLVQGWNIENGVAVYIVR